MIEEKIGAHSSQLLGPLEVDFLIKKSEYLEVSELNIKIEK